jgi:hypothetical protein
MHTVMKIAIVTLVAVLSGCATCRSHPVACGVAGAVVTGSIAATIIANDHHHRQQPLQRIVCEPGVTACGSEP